MTAPPQPSVVSDEIDLDNLDDEDEPTSVGASSGRGGGFGVKVSSLERDPASSTSQTVPEDSIHEFAISGDLEKLRSTIQKGVDINMKDEYVSERKMDFLYAMIDMLLKSQGFTPLHLACDRGQVEVVRVLLDSGARKDIKVGGALFLVSNKIVDIA